MKYLSHRFRSPFSGRPSLKPRRAGRTGAESGVALIITLILLSIITFMAITFLVLSQRERGSVSTTTDQMKAKGAADSAVERVKIELLAPMIAYRNPQAYDFFVSTNFINEAGFDPTAYQDQNQYTNVNFNGLMNSGPPATPLTALQWQQNLTNLLYDPRPPVFIVTNQQTGVTEFRYYLDLNRNGRFDGSGMQVTVSADTANPFFGTNASGVIVPQASIIPGNTVSNIVTGDPQWVGVLEYPDRAHSSSNRFVARYAYVAVPADGTLDLNAIHNNAKQKLIYTPGSDGFYRNQGVGPWEINLAAGLADLNSNVWNNASLGGIYNYDLTYANVNRGAAFDDASSILVYRYARLLLRTANNLFPNPNSAGLPRDNIDMYSDGPLDFGTKPTDETLAPTAFGIPDNINYPWPGADNPRHYFTLQTVFDPNNTSVAFTNRIRLAGLQTNSYDAYTYYRFIQNFGTESQPEPVKINVNFRNTDANGIVVPGMETNLLPWTPDLFFLSSANRLLRQSTEVWARENLFDYTNTFGVNEPFGITNIPVYVTYTAISNLVLVTNVMSGYTPAVHRLLQVVANVYDATTNRIVGTATTAPYLPTVWRPIFRRGTNEPYHVFIVGYREVTDARMSVAGTAPAMLDLQVSSDRQQIPIMNVPINTNNLQMEPMVTGIPLVIGAKKGIPGFSKFAMDNIVQVTRKLRFHRQPGQPVTVTNQIYTVSVSNVFGVQAWNSYSNAYPRQIRILGDADILLTVTNEFGPVTGPNGLVVSNRFQHAIVSNAPPNWPGFRNQQRPSFKLAALTNTVLLTNDPALVPAYAQNVGGGGQFRTSGSNVWDAANNFEVPKLWLNTRVRLRLILVDVSANRIIDYVNLDSTEAPVNLMAAVMRSGGGCDGRLPNTGNPDPDCFWCTNRVGFAVGTGPQPDTPAVPTYGIRNQINVSRRSASPPDDNFWLDYSANNPPNKSEEMETFDHRLNPGDDLSTMTQPSDCDFSSPFQPTRTFVQYVKWEVNDPIVHYTTADLLDLFNSAVPMAWPAPNSGQPFDNDPIESFTGNNPLSGNYKPWGGNPNNRSATSPVDTRWSMAFKDPFVGSPEDWDFPTNKMPNVGWLGRVHRGTPWQTVYMKSSDLGLTNYPVHITNAISWVKFYDIPERAFAPRMWKLWSGNTNLNDAYYSRPVQDRILFDVFTASMNDNALHGRLSINQSAGRTNDLIAGLPAWSAVLSGVILVTNKANEWTVINPASTDGAVANIVRGINRTRWGTNLVTGLEIYPQRRFMHLGDLLATPELTFASPYLNLNPSILQNNTGPINDEIVERIPQQIMGLLTLNESPRFVIYAYGQTLHPAPNSVIRTAGPYFGLCTNYQVTAESAIRCVVRIDGITPTNRVPRLVVEQYNVLPPD